MIWVIIIKRLYAVILGSPACRTTALRGDLTEKMKNTVIKISIIRKLIALLPAAVLSVSLLTGCSGGDKIEKQLPEGFTLEASYRSDGIHSISVKDGSGKETFGRKVTQSNGSQPYSDADGLEYGLTVMDIDLDGYTDVVVCTQRKAGNEKYLFLFGDGEGGFSEARELSRLRSPVFGGDDGTVRATTHTIEYESRDIPGLPDLYTEIKMTTVYKRVEGKIVKAGAEALTFYSEEDVYCYTTYIPDDSKEGLTEDRELWIQPGELDKYGLEPFEFRG